MLKIGEFSKMTHVTVKALRHYAELGLLRPAWVDRFTGYRYYRLEQLPRLNRILALKDLGFSLQQIKPLLDSNLNASQMRSILSQKQIELVRRLQAEQERVARVESRLRQIEQEGHLSAVEVALKRVPPLQVACLRQVVPTIEVLPQWIARLTAEIRAWLQQADLRSPGLWLSILHNNEYTERNIDLELAAPLEFPPAASLPAGQVALRTLPAVETMACAALVSGSLPEAYAGLYAWNEANAYRANAPARELCRMDHAAAWQVIEVQLPVEPAERSILKSTFTPQEIKMMQPRFVTRPAFNVVGLQYVGKNEHQEISQMWGRLNPRHDEIPNLLEGEAFGLCVMLNDADPGVFEYVAGFPVAGDPQPPPGMVARSVPAQKYAVFTHRGPLEALKDTFSYVYQVWLPQSGCQHAGIMDMEVYGEKFKAFAPDSELEIYLPIEE
jgi:predicted transcriptional regulator YdeE/DNA-binding transcriptional MerR regulator